MDEDLPLGISKTLLINVVGTLLKAVQQPIDSNPHDPKSEVYDRIRAIEPVDYFVRKGVSKSSLTTFFKEPNVAPIKSISAILTEDTVQYTHDKLISLRSTYPYRFQTAYVVDPYQTQEREMRRKFKDCSFYVFVGSLDEAIIAACKDSNVIVYWGNLLGIPVVTRAFDSHRSGRFDGVMEVTTTKNTYTDINGKTVSIGPGIWKPRSRFAHYGVTA